MLSLYQLFEWSKSDIIPEINRERNKLAVFVFGSPAVGKTTFIRSYFGSARASKPVSSHDMMAISGITTPSGNQFKLFNTDTVSALFTRNVNVYKRGTTSLVMQMIDRFTDGGKNFIFDTTGNSTAIIKQLVDGCRGKGYKVLFIQLFTDIEVASNRNAGRDRSVSAEYLRSSASKVPVICDMLSGMGPDTFYLIDTDDAPNYVFYKREGDVFLMRGSRGQYTEVQNPLLSKNIGTTGG